MIGISRNILNRIYLFLNLLKTFEIINCLQTNQTYFIRPQTATIEYKRLAPDLAQTGPATLDHKFFLWRKRQTNFLTKTTNIMNALRNKVQLIGHLGAKVELKTLESGKVVGHANIATNESYKNQKGERVTETTWHRLVMWGKNAELLEKYTDKGSEIAIEGKISNRDYSDKDGVKRYITEIVVNDFLLLGEKTAKMKEEADLPL